MQCERNIRFVYTHFKSCDQSLDTTSFDFFNVVRVIQNCAMNVKEWHNTKNAQEDCHMT